MPKRHVDFFHISDVVSEERLNQIERYIVALQELAFAEGAKSGVEEMKVICGGLVDHSCPFLGTGMRE